MVSRSLIVEPCNVLTFHHLDHRLTEHCFLAGNGWVSLNKVTAALECVQGAKRMYGTMVKSSHLHAED